MKLYANPRSDSCRFIQNICSQIDINLEYVSIDFDKNEQRSEAYLKLSPTGKVPLLQDDEYILSETFAIAKYLIDKQIHNIQIKLQEQDLDLVQKQSLEKILSRCLQLYPTDVKKRAVVDMNCGIINELRVNMLSLAYGRVFLPSQGIHRPESVLQQHESIAYKIFNELNENFGSMKEDSRNICGFENDSLVDWMLCQIIIDYDSLAIDHSEKHPYLMRYAMEMTEEYSILCDGYDRFNALALGFKTKQE
eukprot:403339477